MKPPSAGGAAGGAIGALAMSMVAGVLVAAAVTPVVALSGMAATTAVDVFEKLPNHLNPSQLAEASTLYAKNAEGVYEEIAVVYDQDRRTAKWEDISQFVKDATVAEEDPRFYTHGGVDILSSGRAVLQNATGSGYSGASTVTMQYVRNVLIQDALAIPDEEKSEAAYKAAMKDSIDRKLKEMRLAISIEKKYSKDDILLGYLNIALFGRKIYGIESAANYYFSKSAKDLTLAEAASLVATVNNPSKLQIDIKEKIPANKERRDKILNSMLRHGKITQAQFDEAIATEVTPKITTREPGCFVAEQRRGVGAFCDYVLRTIKKDRKFGETPEESAFNFSRGGYKIYTTIDLGMQEAALRATQENVAPLMEGINVGSATSSVEVGTGRVLAMTQNRPYNNAEDFLSLHPEFTTINYNTNYEDGGSSGFQVGSTFKPITLAEWIRNGNSVQDIVNVNGRTVQENSLRASCMPDKVYGFGSFTFTNDNMGTTGNRSVLTAIANSVNGGLVSMQQKLDLCDTISMAQKLGIYRASDQPVWTQEDVDAERTTQDQVGKNKLLTLHGKPRELTLAPSNVYGGVDEIAPITMASAFGAFAGDGTVCEPSPIDEILDTDDKPVAFTKGKCTEAISPEVAAGVAYALQYAVTNGLADHAKSTRNIPHLAKTGTTDHVIDNWTVGASTKVATATWVGNAGPTQLADGSWERVSTQGFLGPNGALLMEADQRIWPAVMDVADANYGGESFRPPSEASVRQNTAQIPDLRGKSYDEAAAMLTRIGFAPANGGEVDSSVPPGQVASTEPAAGATVAVGSGITIFVSNGRASAIPDGLIGEIGSSAEATLNGAGFTSVTSVCEAGGKIDKRKHRVVSVDPASGTEVPFSQQIQLTLACSKP
ncbi:transglycosylase domain-containing protein [Leucobacter viscericola]|uniref:transglycosylase domain-containing protein n=1 Tax=Leucobacter viscericola TaxID=2714935 RepID=UPI001FCBBCC7|nr:transglycosylase domain-containing protein [Leucobacter viscericola]